MFTAILFLLFAIFSVHGSDSIDCLNRCTVSDRNLNDCWPNLLEFFNEELLQSIKAYSTVMLHIQRWKVLHPEGVERYANFEEDVLEQVLQRYIDSEADTEYKALGDGAMENIFSVIINQTRAVIREHHTNAEDVLPGFHCPIPCDYYPRIWMALFFVTFAVFLLACLSFVVYYSVHMRTTLNTHYAPVASDNNDVQ